MKNRITVTIAGQTFTLLTDGDAAFTQRVAQHVDGKIAEVQQGTHLSLSDAAILASMNITEAYLKEAEGAENLRRQFKDCLEESSKLKLELSEAKREIFSLKNRK